MDLSIFRNLVIGPILVSEDGERFRQGEVSCVSCS